MITGWNLEEGPLCQKVEHVSQPSLKVQEICPETGWDVEKLEQLVGADMASEIMGKVSSRIAGNDILIWKPNVQCIFSSKSAWDVIGVRASTVDWVESFVGMSY